jgi:hypothetical protein
MGKSQCLIEETCEMLSESNKILFMAKFSIEWPESQSTENTALLTEVVIPSARQFVFGVTVV